MCTYMAPSLDVRQDITVVEVPKLGKEAVNKAIKEWGQPKSKITHLVLYTSCSVDMPSANYQLTKLLGLPPSVRRLMMYQQGCYASGTVVSVAKDLAENNKGARVLVVCSEITAVCFRGPSDANLDSLLGKALFGDGTASMIIGPTRTPSWSVQFSNWYQQLKPSYQTLRAPLKDTYKRRVSWSNCKKRCRRSSQIISRRV